MNDEDKSLNLHHQNSLTSGEFQMEIHKTADYKYEEERIKSFSSWKVHYPVDPDRLAKAGFFYTGNEDEVVCFSCHGHIKGWNYGDVVLKKHAEMFPNCNFVNNKSNNVPLAQSKKSKDNLIISGKKKNGYSQPTKLSPVVNAIDYNKMKSVQERIKTFSRNWPLSCIDASQIAQAGFFYLGLGDKVQCPFCKGIVSNWEDADDPLKEHIKHFPWCDYLSGISSDFSRKKLPWFKVDSEDLCGNMKKSSISSEKYKQFQSQENQEAMDLKKLGVHLYNEPAFPQQASYGARLRSYSTWPTSAPVSKEELARAGFFYIGILDHTKCFHCNGGLCNWEPGDDPWVEHARWYHDCDFLRFNKDETFIETCVEKQLSKKKLELDIPEQLSSFECPGSLLIQVDEAMKSNIVKQLLETNVFAPYIIRAAIVRQIKETGYAFNTVDELCFAVSYLKNEMERDPIKMNKCHPTDLNIQSVQLRMPMVASNSQNSTIECGETSLKSSTVSEEKGTEEATIPIKGTEEATIPIKGTEEATISKDHCLCKICMDQEVRVVFLPCGHLLTCTECASALKSCPMCRKDIQATVRAYLP